MESYNRRVGRLRSVPLMIGATLGMFSAALAWQQPWREYPGQDNIAIPPDFQEKTEWAFARLMFPPGPLNGYRGRDWPWREGNSLWSQDFPRADRHFSLAVRRLTRVHVRSAGSEPSDRLNPAVVEAMAELGLDISREFPKPLTDEVVRAADVVITMGCGDACPLYPGKRYLDWELEDPAGKSLATVRRIRDEIEERVQALLLEIAPAPVD